MGATSLLQDLPGFRVVSVTETDTSSGEVVLMRVADRHSCPRCGLLVTGKPYDVREVRVKGPADGAPAGEGGVAQAALPLPGAALPTADLHRAVGPAAAAATADRLAPGPPRASMAEGVKAG